MLTPAQQIQIIEDFIEHHNLESIPRRQLYDTTKYFVEKGRVKLHTALQGVLLVDPTSPDAPQVFDADRLKVKPLNPSVLLLTDELIWAAQGSQCTQDIASVGYRELWLQLLQTWTTVPATLNCQPNYSDEIGTRYSDDNDEALTVLTPGNMRTTFLPLYYSATPVIATSAVVMGEIAAAVRIQFTTTDPSVGSVNVRVWGSQ